MDRYTTFRENKPYIGSDKFFFGWLYSMCYLPDYRIPLHYTITEAKQSNKKNIDLYLFCDSYLYTTAQKKHFSGVDSLIKIKWWEISTYKYIKSLNAKKHNILVLEMAERYVRDICTNEIGMTNLLQLEKSGIPKVYTQFTETPFFNPFINSNLELNLFDYPFFRPFKEFKAQLNHKVFNRINKDVYLDTTTNFLYYMPTVQGEQKMNSFYPIDTAELARICTTLNKIYLHFKHYGFDEIYISIIPNTVTIVNPKIGIYNNLIPAIYLIDSLKIKPIDVYSLYSKNPAKYFSRNDTHWNSEGLQVWLNVLNKNLAKFADTK